MLTSSPSAAAQVCPECGQPLVCEVNTGGLCPRCLMAAAVAHLNTVDHPALGRFGQLGATPTADELNEKLPQFEFAELLGRGGAGWVFRARQRSLDRPVAIKLLHGNSAGVTDAAERFEREAQILARLKHPRIVTVYDYGTVNDGPYIVMEYVTGPTLREVLRGPRLDWQTALRAADQICEAVEYAHHMGVLHRDLKPENVLFDSFGHLDHLKVADFGISRLIGDTEPGFHQTQTGFVVGTPFYAAPEQMLAYAAVDKRADIFSIGVMLYEMLTGQLPRGRFAPPSRLARVPAAVDAVALRCLESDPNLRYADVPALRHALRRASHDANRWWRTAALIAAVAVVTGIGALVTIAALVGTLPDAAGERSPQPAAARVASRSQPASDARAPAPHSNAEIAAGPPAEVQLPPPAPTGNTSNPPRLPHEVLLQSVAVAGHVPFALRVRIEGALAHKDFAIRDGASFVWVVQMPGGRRVDMPFTVPPGEQNFTIDAPLSLHIHDGFPLDIFIAERWYEPDPGSRPLSTSVRIQSGDVRSTFPP